MSDDEGLPGHPAAYAPNWWRVLLADALVGLVPLAGGVAGYVMAWNVYLCATLITVGVSYDFLVYRRYRQWSYWRAKSATT